MSLEDVSSKDNPRHYVVQPSNAMSRDHQNTLGKALFAGNAGFLAKNSNAAQIVSDRLTTGISAELAINSATSKLERCAKMKLCIVAIMGEFYYRLLSAAFMEKDGYRLVAFLASILMLGVTPS